MAKGFSLAGAIGGTGQAQIPDWLYKQRAAERAGGFDDPAVKAISQNVFVDPNKYHRIYEQEMKNATANFINTYIQKKQTKSSDMSSWLLTAGSELMNQRAAALNRSQELKDLEQLGMGGKRAGLYVSPSVLEANSILSQVTSPDEYMTKLQEAAASGRISMDDPYFQFNSNDRSIATNTHAEIDYNKTLADLWKGQKMTEIGEYSYGEGDGKVRELIYGIPRTAADARRLSDKKLLETGVQLDITNAYDAGKNLYQNDYTVRTQFLAEHPELKGATPEEQYDQFYKIVVEPTIPTIEKQTFNITSRPGFSVNNYLNPETSASFQGSPETVNIYDGKSTKSLRTSILSKKPEGVDVMVPNTHYLRSLNDNSILEGGAAKNFNIKFSQVAVWPSYQWETRDGKTYWKALSTEEANLLKSQGKQVKYRAFAVGNYSPITVGSVQEQINIPVYIPLYESGISGLQNKIIGAFSNGVTRTEKPDFDREVNIIKQLNESAYQ